MIHRGGIGKKGMDAGLDENTLCACMEFSNNKEIMYKISVEKKASHED